MFPRRIPVIALATCALVCCFGDIESSRRTTAVIVVTNTVKPGTKNWTVVLRDAACPTRTITITPDPRASRQPDLACFEKLAEGARVDQTHRLMKQGCMPGKPQRRFVAECAVGQAEVKETGDDCSTLPPRTTVDAP